MIVSIIILLFVLSIFFSISETALTSLSPVRLQTQAKAGNKRAEKLLHLTENPSELYTVTVIGDNIVDLTLVALVVYWTIDMDISTVLAVIIAIIAVIVFAEVIPKAIARKIPMEVASIVSPIIQIIMKILRPVIWILNKLAITTAERFSEDDKEEVSISKEELRTLIELAGLEGTFRADESYRIKGVLDFYHLNVRDVMKTPRVDMVALPIDSTYDEVRDFAIQNRFTRYPIYEEDLDNIVGIMHTKYLLSWSVNPERKLKDFMDDDPLVVYEFQPVEDIFRKMTKERRHLAIVLDEYGGTEGIITHEDIIEGMIGLEIHDEMDKDNEVLIEKLTPTMVICDGKVTLHRLNTIFQTEIPEEEDVLAAYLLSEFQDFPKVGDVLERGNLTFKILSVEDRTIRKVQIVK